MIFLVDYENVSNSGLVGIDKLGENDRLIIFYSKHANNISIETHIKLEESKVKKEYIEIQIGTKNALDFQLSTYLGALIKENSNEDFAIISKDAGYHAVIDFWKLRNKTVDIYVSVDKTELLDIKNEVQAVLPEHEDKIVTITEILKKYKTKQGINNALVKEYKSETAGVLYKAIKPLLKEKK